MYIYIIMELMQATSFDKYVVSMLFEWENIFLSADKAWAILYRSIKYK
jgi:hypothetical protein